MFERFTEAARRALFFARFETTELGGDAIEPEHMLLGLLRTDRGPLPGVFARANVSYRQVWAEIQSHRGERQQVAPHVEIPFSAQTKRLLQYTQEEANRADHQHIDAGHLLLGILRDERSFAAEILNRHGITLTQAREQIAMPDAIAAPKAVDAVHVIMAIEQIRFLAEQIAASQSGPDAKRSLLDAIHHQLDVLKQHLTRT
jgi:ATP-dependent Clp protease ATP-binding subunit ClpC